MARYCTSCGQIIENSAKFCTACGKPIQTAKAEPQKNTVNEVNTKKKAPETGKKPISPRQADGKQTAKPAESQRNGKKKGFFAQLWAETLELLKHPKKLIPTFVLAVIWLVMPMITGFVAGANIPIVRFFCTLTYANGGVLGGFFGTVGGIFGKAIFAAVVNGFILSLCNKKNPFKGVKKGIGGVFAGGLKAISPLLIGGGAGLILYWFFNITSAPQNCAIAVVAAIAAVQAVGKQNGIVFGGVFYLMKKLSKGRAPSKIAVSRILMGLSAGFAIGFALTFLRYALVLVLLGVLLFGAGIGILFIGKNGAKKTVATAALVLMLGGLAFSFFELPVYAAGKEGYPYTNNEYFRYGMSYGNGQVNRDTGKYTREYDIQIMSRDEYEVIEKDKVIVEVTGIPRLSSESYSYFSLGNFFCEEIQDKISSGIDVQYGATIDYGLFVCTQDEIIENMKASFPNWTYKKATVGGYPSVQAECDKTTEYEGSREVTTEGRIYIIVDDVLIPNCGVDEDAEYQMSCPILTFTYSLSTLDGYYMDDSIGTVATYEELHEQTRQTLNSWLDDFFAEVGVTTTYDENIIKANYKYDDSKSAGNPDGDKDEGYVPYRGRLTYTSGKVNKHGQPFPDLMDFNRDGYVDYEDRQIQYILVHNPDYLDTPKEAGLVATVITTTIFGTLGGAAVSTAASAGSSALSSLTSNLDFPEDEENSSDGGEYEKLVKQTDKYISTDSVGDLTVRDPVTGAEKHYIKQEDGSYRQLESGQSYTKDEIRNDLAYVERNSGYYSDVEKSRAEAAEYQREHASDLSEDGKKMSEMMRQEKAEQERQDKLYELGAKHGIYSGDKAEIREKMAKDQAHEEQMNKKYHEIAENMDTTVTVVETTQVVADVSLDALETVAGPAGKAVNAAYKVTKGAAGKGAEAYAKGEDVTTGILQGGIEGSIDAGTGFLSGGVKAGATVAGETAKGALDSYIKGEDVSEGAKSGLLKGTVNATIDAAGDFIAEEAKAAATKDISSTITNAISSESAKGIASTAKTVTKAVDVGSSVAGNATKIHVDKATTDGKGE